MKIRDAIAAGIAHLHQDRLRAGLSILGMLIGIASVLCMMAIGDGAKLLIAKDLEKLGGANQVQLWTRSTIWKRGRLARTTERYTLEDAYAIEAECPKVLFVLPKNERFRPHLVSSRYGSQPSPHLEGVTADYALGMHWEIQGADSSLRTILKTQLKSVSWVPILPVNCSRKPLLLVKK